MIRSLFSNYRLQYLVLITFSIALSVSSMVFIQVLSAYVATNRQLFQAIETKIVAATNINTRMREANYAYHHLELDLGF